MFTCDIIKTRKLNTDNSNVIYHKFSHGAVSYTLNGDNVNVMLESETQHDHGFGNSHCSALGKNEQ